MKRLFYVRHGETKTNASGVWAGHIETTLTEKGIAQAKQAGKSLKDKLPILDLIICSPLSRAYDTATAIAKEINYPIEKVQKNKIFIERAFGDLEGTSWDDFMNNNDIKDIDKVNGAETVKELHDRATKALEYVKTLSQDNILIVSHGSFGRAFLRVVNNLPHTHEYLESHREKYRIGNAEIVELI